MGDFDKKVFKWLLSALGWLFGVTFIFASLEGLIQGDVMAALLIAIGASVFIPPVRQWVLKQINYEVTGKKLVVSGAMISIIGFAMSSPTPTQDPTPAPQTFVAEQSTNNTAHPEQAKPDTTPVVIPLAPNSLKVTQEPTQAISSAYDISCKVVGVTDGDTINCLTNDKTQIKVRLNQIDAPEKNQAFGTAAKQALSGYIFGKTVGLKTNGTDKYGRTIAEVFVGDQNINKAMVADGYAWAYREYMTDNDYGDLETSARSNTKGLWSEPDPIYPSDFRRGKSGEQTAPVQTQTITQQVEQKAVADSGSSCGSKRYCKQMATCAEARHYLNDCGVSRLDRDGDGVPCESICN